MYCVEIQQGKWSSQQEFADALDVTELDLGHYFEELAPLVNTLPKKKPVARDNLCSCGAKHTSFPEHHLKYCQENK